MGWQLCENNRAAVAWMPAYRCNFALPALAWLIGCWAAGQRAGQGRRLQVWQGAPPLQW